MESVAEHLARKQAVKDKLLAMQRAERDRAARKHKTRHVARINGELCIVAGKPPTELIGRFVNKQGTKRRSSKGAVTTLPNGYARYINPTNNHYEVVMY